MLKHLAVAGSVLGLSVIAAPLRAQQVSGPVGVQITPYAGYMIFGDYLQGPIGTRLSNANGPMYGAQIGLSLGENVALVGNIARANADLQVGVPVLGGLSVGNSAAWLFDGSLQLSVPLVGRVLPIAPFVQAGAGVMRHEVASSVVRTDATNFVFNAGVGADISLAPMIGLRLMAKDYVGKFDVKEASGLNVEGKYSHNWGLSAGLKLAF